MAAKSTTLVRQAVGKVGQRRQVILPRAICQTLRLEEGDFVAFTPQANGVLIKRKRRVDPDDVLTAEQTVLLKKAERQMSLGQHVSLAALEHELDRKPRARGRKTA